MKSSRSAVDNFQMKMRRFIMCNFHCWTFTDERTDHSPVRILKKKKEEEEEEMKNKRRRKWWRDATFCLENVARRRKINGGLWICGNERRRNRRMVIWSDWFVRIFPWLNAIVYSKGKNEMTIISEKTTSSIFCSYFLYFNFK